MYVAYAFFVVNSTVIVIIKRANKVFHFFKRLLFWAKKFKQHWNLQSPDGIGDGRYLVDITEPFIKPPSFYLDK